MSISLIDKTEKRTNLVRMPIFYAKCVDFSYHNPVLSNIKTIKTYTDDMLQCRAVLF